MADLKGKRIGIQEPGGFADVLSRGVLRAAKIDPKDVNFVSIATEDVPALVANQVDTAILHVEQEMLAQEQGADPARHRAHVGAAAEDALHVPGGDRKDHQGQAGRVQAFVKANIEATRLMYTDKAKVLPILVKYTGYPEKIARKTLRLHGEELHLGCQHGLVAERVNFTAELMTKVGNITAGQDAEIRRHRRLPASPRRRSRSSASGKARFVRPQRSDCASTRRTPVQASAVIGTRPSNEDGIR